LVLGKQHGWVPVWIRTVLLLVVAEIRKQLLVVLVGTEYYRSPTIILVLPKLGVVVVGSGRVIMTWHGFVVVLSKTS
jgi:hypothetical protein